MAKVINHQHLFTTDLKYFKALQIIGGKSIFERYNAAKSSIIGKVIDTQYQDFLAWPIIEDDRVEFHGIRSSEEPRLFSDLPEEERLRYQRIKEETVTHYQSKAKELEDAGKLNEAKFISDAIKVVDDRFLYCYDGKVVLGAWGMQMKDNVRDDISEIRKTMQKKTRPVTESVPEPAPVPTPTPEPEPVSEPIPDPEPVVAPEPEVVVHSKTRRKWNWRAIWKWLRWLLLLLLLLLLAWLASRLIPGCNPTAGGIYNPSNPYGTTPTPPAFGGILPPNQGVLPPSDDLLIVPGNPSIVANRLNILMENEDKSVLDFAKAFKEAYPADKYKIVYYDDVVKRLQIEVPSEERETLKKEIPPRFSPDYELYVFY